MTHSCLLKFSSSSLKPAKVSLINLLTASSIAYNNKLSQVSTDIPPNLTLSFLPNTIISYSADINFVIESSSIVILFIFSNSFLKCTYTHSGF
jgi:hypothetical protein